MTSNKPISVTYSDEKLRVLVEEYITMQRNEFTFKGVCSFVLYRAMEEEQTKIIGLYESDELIAADCDRIAIIMEKILHEQRIANISPSEGSVMIPNDNRYKKISC